MSPELLPIQIIKDLTSIYILTTILDPKQWQLITPHNHDHKCELNVCIIVAFIKGIYIQLLSICPFINLMIINYKLYTIVHYRVTVYYNYV